MAPPRSLLSIHGTRDGTLRYLCSQEWYNSYEKKGETELKLCKINVHCSHKSSGKA